MARRVSAVYWLWFVVSGLEEWCRVAWACRPIVMSPCFELEVASARMVLASRLTVVSPCDASSLEGSICGAVPITRLRAASPCHASSLEEGVCYQCGSAVAVP